MRTRGNSGIIGRVIIPGQPGTVAAQDVTVDTLSGSWPGSNYINIYGGGGGGGGALPAVSNVVVTNSSYSNTYGNILSGGYIKMYGTNFQSNTVVTVNANNILQANVIFVSSTQLDISLPLLANISYVSFSVANPGSTTTIAKVSTPYVSNYLVVGGGGGGGYLAPASGAGATGGGAGGMLTGCATFTPGTSYTINVGVGGSTGVNGSSSNLSGPGIITVCAAGGGHGASNTGVGAPGASGGGGSGPLFAGGSGIPGEGYPGGTAGSAAYSGGGGGGAGAAGGSGSPGGYGPGGTGKIWPYSGLYYAGGGAGGCRPSGLGGGAGGGGTSGYPGTFATGGGGGGAGPSYYPTGGPGVVIVTVPSSNYPGTAPASANTVICAPPSYPGIKLVIFTSPGTYTA